MPAVISDLWVYLAASPLSWLTATLAAYLVALRVSRLARDHPLANPVAIAVLLLIAVLAAVQVPYREYFAGAQFIHFLLGPATVALGVSLAEQMPLLRRHWLLLSCALCVGVVVAAGSALVLGGLLGLEEVALVSLAPKSTTSPVAMAIAESLGGIPSLTAALVVTTGILGAMIGPPLLKLSGVKDPTFAGFVLGTVAHGIGTARSFQIDARMGAFSGLAMALATLANAIIVPWLWAIYQMVR